MESENNIVMLKGTVYSAPEFSHEVYGERFYKVILRVPRLSETDDYLPLTISERLMGSIDILKGRAVELSGQFRSYNNYSSEGNRLILTVFVREIKNAEEGCNWPNPNEIMLNGFLCKTPVYRKTPFGREITDLLLAVNRSYNKSDYIPCIAWGRNARYCQQLEIGQNIRIWGRVQSREYLKKIDEETSIIKTAYEVSISKFEVVDKDSEPVLSKII